MAETIGTERTAAGSSAHTLAQAKDIGSELIDAVRDGATSLFEEQRDRAANEIASFGEVLRRSVSSPSWTAGSEQPIGGARHDYGAVGGGVSSDPRAGYGAGPGREVG